MILLFRLMRSQFGLSAGQGLRAAYWEIRAALAWKPRNHDSARVGRQLTRFYEVLRDATGADFAPDVAGAAELHYWTVHRALDGQEGAPELVEAHAQIVSAVYGLSRERALPAATARAHACDLVDAITDGRRASTPDAWDAVVAALRQAYSLLREALRTTGNNTGIAPERPAV